MLGSSIRRVDSGTPPPRGKDQMGMMEMMMQKTYGTLAFAALVVTLASVQPASADCFVPAGNDCFTTAPSRSSVKLPAIPANTFGVGSDPIPAGRIIRVKGSPLPLATVTALCPQALARPIDILFGPAVPQPFPPCDPRLGCHTDPGDP